MLVSLVIVGLQQQPDGRTQGLQFGDALRVPSLGIQGENHNSSLSSLYLTLVIFLLNALLGEF